MSDLSWVIEARKLIYDDKKREAEDLLYNVITRDRNSEENWLNAGFLFHRMEKYENACDAYNVVIDINPTNSDAWCAKGSALSEIGKIKEAMLCYDQSLSINPKNTDTLACKAMTLYDAGRTREAVAVIEAAQLLNPDDELVRRVGKRLHKQFLKSWRDDEIEDRHALHR